MGHVLCLLILLGWALCCALLRQIRLSWRSKVTVSISFRIWGIYVLTYIPLSLDYLLDLLFFLFETFVFACKLARKRLHLAFEGLTFSFFSHQVAWSHLIGFFSSQVHLLLCFFLKAADYLVSLLQLVTKIPSHLTFISRLHSHWLFW